jgi:hypothetical protein
VVLTRDAERHGVMAFSAPTLRRRLGDTRDLLGDRLALHRI